MSQIFLIVSVCRTKITKYRYANSIVARFRQSNLLSVDIPLLCPEKMKEKRNHEYWQERNAWIDYFETCKNTGYKIFHVTVNFFNTKQFTNPYACCKSLRYWYLRYFLPKLMNTTNTKNSSCKKRQPIVLGWLERHQSKNRYHIIREAKKPSAIEHLPTNHYHLILVTNDEKSISQLMAKCDKRIKTKDASSNGVEDYFITRNNEYLVLYPDFEDYKNYSDVQIEFGYKNEKSSETVGSESLK